jgi:hypothetical protein
MKTEFSINRAIGAAALTILLCTLAQGCRTKGGPNKLGGSSHEPTGMTLISDRAFDAPNESGWRDDNWGSATGGKFIRDGKAPKSPGNILRTTLPAGFPAGGGTFSGDLTFAPQRTLYISYWARLSKNWEGSDSGIDKQFYVYTSSGVPSVVFTAHGTEYEPKSPVVEGQDILAGGIGSDTRDPDFGPNVIPTATIPRGEWYRMEMVVVGNSPGKRDGSIDWYVNGAHVGSYSKIQFTPGAAQWSVFHFTNLWTGDSTFKTRESQTLDFDHVYLSGKN